MRRDAGLHAVVCRILVVEPVERDVGGAVELVPALHDVQLAPGVREGRPQPERRMVAPRGGHLQPGLRPVGAAFLELDLEAGAGRVARVGADQPARKHVEDPAAGEAGHGVTRGVAPRIGAVPPPGCDRTARRPGEVVDEDGLNGRGGERSGGGRRSRRGLRLLGRGLRDRRREPVGHRCGRRAGRSTAAAPADTSTRATRPAPRPARRARRGRRAARNIASNLATGWARSGEARTVSSHKVVGRPTILV